MGRLRVRDLRGGPFANDWSGFSAALSAGQLYLNALTRANPAGEVRGQIAAVGTQPTNHPPVGIITAPAANVTIQAGDSVPFSATATDPDGDAVTGLWDFGDGTTSALLSPGAHTYPAAGTFTVRFTATDSQGLADPAPPTRVITVQPAVANQPPTTAITAPAADVSITPGQSVTFTGTATDPNGDTLTVLWNFGDGATSTLLAPGAHTYAAAGTYTVSFTATDSGGLSTLTPATRVITVQPAASNLPPTATITAPAADTSISAGQSVSFAGTASDPNAGDTVSVLWDFGDGSTSTLLTPGAHTYATAGTYTVTLTATDNHGLAATTPATRTVTVASVAVNLPPTATITAPAANSTISAGQSVSFAGTASDPNAGDTVTVVWAFGDGATSTLLTPGAHTYAAAGTYTVTLTATDNHGLAATTPPTRTITVTAVNSAATLTQVQTAVFNSCTSCHSAGGSAGMNLTAGSAFANLVNVPATTLPGLRVVPGNPSASALVTQLAGGHRSVSAANQALISSWIAAGALNN